MAHKAIREADGKRMLARLFKDYSEGKYSISDKIVTVDPCTDVEKLPKQYEWLTNEKLVVKPDQLIKRRGKNNLVLVNVGKPHQAALRLPSPANPVQHPGDSRLADAQTTRVRSGRLPGDPSPRARTGTVPQ